MIPVLLLGRGRGGADRLDGRTRGEVRAERKAFARVHGVRVEPEEGATLAHLREQRCRAEVQVLGGTDRRNRPQRVVISSLIIHAEYISFLSKLHEFSQSCANL